MLGSLREAFRQAVENFRAELNGVEAPQASDPTLRRMQLEAARVVARRGHLEVELVRVRREAARNEEEVATCTRRAELAREIGDRETERVALEFAERHRRRLEILSRKAEVLAMEVEECGRELDDLRDRLREALRLADPSSSAAG